NQPGVPGGPVADFLLPPRRLRGARPGLGRAAGRLSGPGLGPAPRVGRPTQGGHAVLAGRVWGSGVNMLRGVALAYSCLPLSLIARHGLDGRAASRGGEREVRFLWSDWPRVLPVWHRDHLLLASWGCRRDESRRLPPTG